jgi:hypothetical protein
MTTQIVSILNPESNEERKLNITNRKNYRFDEVTDLMLAVSAKRTMIHYGHKHLCITHQCKVDKSHIDECRIFRANLRIK